MRQQWIRPLKTLRVGMIGTVPERYLSGCANAERFGTFWEVLQVWELWGDEGAPPYFEGGEFISEGFQSSFDDMFDNLWFGLNFWPLLAAAARLLAGEEIATWWSPVPPFLFFGWTSTL